MPPSRACRNGNAVWLPDSKQLARYMELSQIGLEMVAPIGLGALLDYWIGWGPWSVITGAILGLVVGMMHLISFVNRKPDGDAKSDNDSKGDSVS